MARSTVTIRTPTVDAARYPVSEWNSQLVDYYSYWDHFDGTWLDDTVGGDSKALLYPLQLNPFNMACLLHAGFLFGEIADPASPLVSAVVEPWGQNSSAQERDLAQRLTDLVNRVWYENDGRSVMQEAGIICQVLGGCVFGVAYDPFREAGFLPVRIDHVMPEYFYPVWAPNHYFNLVEAIIAFEISSLQAQELYGVEASYTNALYTEHWTRQHYETTVDGKPASWYGIPLSGVPIANLVPYTYIPHIRVGSFYGTSLLDRKLDLAKEINLVWADLGDIVGENARALPAVGNTQKITVRRLDGGYVILDLGRSIPGMGDPWIKYPSTAETNASMTEWAQKLLDTARTEAYTPPVCYGLDEGSQRSALTLAFRMIPLISHIRQERNNWTAGLGQVARRILFTAIAKGVVEGVDLSVMQRLRVWQDWAPILPRDREQEVNEIILRHNAHLISPEQALQRLGDVRDIKTEMNLIKAWMEYTSSLGAPQGQDPFKGTGSGGQNSGLNKPKTPQANIAKE